MQATSPILSVCIPTYNRAPLLMECLLSVISAAKGYEHEVEIVVSDNASQDDTSMIAESVRPLYPDFNYVRRATNIGGERNFRYVASLAKGQFVWIFGDDDKMSENAIREVLARINAGFNLIICNYSMWTKDFSSPLKRAALATSPDETYYAPDALMKAIGPNMGYISSVIIRKALFFELPTEKYEAFVEYGFPFMYAVYKGVHASCRAIYLAEPLVLNRTGNSGDGYDWYKYFVSGTSLILEALKVEGYSSKAIHFAKHRVITQYVLHDLLVRRRDQKSMKGLLRLTYQHYKSAWLFWFGVLPIFIIPGKLIWMAWRLKKLAIGKRAVSDDVSRGSAQL